MPSKIIRGRWAALAVLPFIVAGAGGLSARVSAGEQGLRMLGALEKGQWEIRYRDGTPPARICLRSGQELIQLKHDAAGCNRFIVEDEPASLTVQYTCRGNGYGRTSIRRESPSLVQIDSQGISGGMPFAVTAEARRVGACG